MPSRTIGDGVAANSRIGLLSADTDHIMARVVTGHVADAERP
ncbi:hypothetical protein [Catenulispora pinisilvae]|nr:hypothetical protein [Catenulispora pinisilvae]